MITDKQFRKFMGRLERSAKDLAAGLPIGRIAIEFAKTKSGKYIAMMRAHRAHSLSDVTMSISGKTLREAAMKALELALEELEAEEK